MTATVRDERGVTHIAIRLTPEETPGGEPVIGAMCEDTLSRFILMNATYTSWSVNEINDAGMPDCMSCIVEATRSWEST